MPLLFYVDFWFYVMPLLFYIVLQISLILSEFCYDKIKNQGYLIGGECILHAGNTQTTNHVNSEPRGCTKARIFTHRRYENIEDAECSRSREG